VHQSWIDVRRTNASAAERKNSVKISERKNQILPTNPRVELAHIGGDALVLFIVFLRPMIVTSPVVQPLEIEKLVQNCFIIITEFFLKLNSFAQPIRQSVPLLSMPINCNKSVLEGLNVLYLPLLWPLYRFVHFPCPVLVPHHCHPVTTHTFKDKFAEIHFPTKHVFSRICR
jgi:hypothetical protein